MTSPARCPSPLHTHGLPPLVEALLTVAVLIAVAYLSGLVWVWMSGPMARHACGACGGRWACQLCVDEDRNARVDAYVAQAREREEKRRG